MDKRRFAAVAACVAAIATVGASGAYAGEITGNGNKEDQNQGRSWCSFSGQNDQVVGEGPVGPRSQSFGQDVKSGDADPHEGNPGFFCNPNHTPLPPNPNREGKNK